MFKSIRIQIAALAVVPLLAVAGFAALSVYEKYEQVMHHDHLRPLAVLAEDGANIIHELQKERGMSVGLVTRGYLPADLQRVTNQRTLTDQAIEVFDLHFSELSLPDPDLMAELNRVAEAVHHVDGFRASVDGRNTTAPNVVSDYTSEIHELLHLIGLVVEASPSQKITQELMPFFALVEAKEAGGLERALGSAMLSQNANGALNFNTYIAYSSHLGAEKAFLSEFEKIAIKEQIVLFDEVVSGADVTQVIAWRDVLAQLPKTQDNQGVEPSVWFDTATKRLNLIKAVSDDLIHRAEAAAQADVDSLTAQMWAIAATAFGVLLLTAAFVHVNILSVSKLLRRQRDSISSLAEGNLNIEIAYDDRPDEVGDIARATKVFRDNSIKQREMEARERGRLERDAERRVHMQGVIEEFRTSVSGIQDALLHVTDEVANSAEVMVQNAQSADETALSTASSVEEASINVEAVAAASTQLSASIQEISRQANVATNVTSSASEAASSTDQDVSMLADTAEKIGDVVGMIRAIAEQTNLLALNATIEAARAGEAGKGFAVVAAEVKQLSDQTAKATDEIGSQIGGIQASTKSAVDAIRAIGSHIEDVRTVTEAIAAAVEEQNAVTQEISESIGRAAQGSTSAAGNVQLVSASISVTREQSENAGRLAEELGAAASTLSIAVSGFLQEVEDNDSESNRNVAA